MVFDIRLKGHIDMPSSDTTLHRQDMRSKIGYVTLCDVHLTDLNRIGGKQWLFDSFLLTM